jgi:integrase
MTRVKPELARDIHKRANELGGFDEHGVKSQIAKEFNISRPTLDKLLITIPKYTEKIYGEYQDFYSIPEIQQYIKVAGTQKANIIKTLWLLLDRKNPMNWDEQDLTILRKHPKISDERTGVIKYEIMGALRKFLRSNKPALFQKEEKTLLYTKGTKAPKGQRRKWFLTPDELHNFIQEMDEIEFSAQVICQFKFGCRHSAFKNLKVEDIDIFPQRDGNIVGMVQLFEPKTKKTWQKWLDEDTYIALSKYINLRKLQGSDKLFKTSITSYNNLMKHYGIKAGLCQYQQIKDKKGNVKWKYISGIPMSSHLLRHTFAFICSINNVSLEETAELGGWEDVNTLKDFYFYVPPEKLKKRYNTIDWNKKEYSRDKMSLIESRNEPIATEELEKLEAEKE